MDGDGEKTEDTDPLGTTTSQAGTEMKNGTVVLSVASSVTAPSIHLSLALVHERSSE
jgi:hypothetical protein